MSADHDEIVSFRAALDTARARLEAAAFELDHAPVYLSRAKTGPWQRLDPRLQKEVDRLAALRREALAHRAAILALEVELDELVRLHQRPGERARAQQAAADWLNGLGGATQLLGELVPDPRRAYLGKRPKMSVGMAEKILGLRDEAGGQVGDFVTFVQNAGFAPDDVRDLEQTGRRLMDPVPKGQAVGVLAPVRIETRFFPPDETSPVWRLRVRIFPEAVSFDRQDGHPTDAEVKHTEQMWRESNGRLQSAEGPLAFQRLAEKCGGARASWLARTLPVVRVTPDGPITVAPVVARVEERRQFHRPNGLPPRLEVWLARGGQAPALAAQLDVDRAELQKQADLHGLWTGGAIDPNTGELPVTWWLSYAEANRVGLATEIELESTVPADIDALYVSGLGDENPRGIFEAHAAAGSLAVLPPGTPTNTVAGEPAADLGRDPATWFDLACSSGLEQSAPRELEMALTGSRAQLSPLTGGSTELREPAEALVSALWPALWNRSLKDVWQAGARAWDAGEWAGRHLSPEGPFPAIRVGDQPYGVLPATALNDWVDHASDPAIESAGLREWVRRIRNRAASLAEAEGNVTGANSERFLDLLGRVPVTPRYGWRWLLPLEWLQMYLYSIGQGVPLGALQNQWDARAAAVLAEGLTPATRNDPRARLFRFPPALMKGDLLAAVETLLEATAELLAGVPDTHWRLAMPLLARLLRHALILTNAESGRAAQALQSGTVEMLDPALLLPLTDADALRSLASAPANDVALDKLSNTNVPLAAAVARSWFSVRDAARRWFRFERGRLDGLLPEVLDTASHRIDPWVTGIASRRLRWLASRRTAFRTGVYGWVDRPRPFVARDPGTSVLPPGPTEAGLLHAPSPPQALTTALLRDRALRDPGDKRWDIALDSQRVRLAERLARHVRLGVHLMEALGREIEQIAGDPAIVLQLRQNFPMRPEHKGRRVCDGEAVLKAALESPAKLPGTLANDVRPLQDVLDTYGDLLVADAVHDLVSGRPERAAEAMEAAAGLGAPPELRLLKTARQGRGVATVALVVLPDAKMPATTPANPVQIADPAFAAFLQNQPDAEGKLAELLAGSDDIPLSLDQPNGMRPLRATAAADLRSRAIRLCAEAAGLRNRLRAATSQTAALLEVLRWNIAVDSALAPADAAETAATILDERLLATPLPAGDDLAALRSLLRAVSGATRLPILFSIPATAIAQKVQSVPAGTSAEWLETVAAVRSSLARLEAHQFGLTPWSAWSNSPDDPWLTNPKRGDRLIMVFGPASVLPAANGARIAIAVLDQWAETIPSREHVTEAVFGFNAPKGRAPQCILIAVPPDTMTPLDNAALVKIIAEARLLARARMARSETLAAFMNALSLPLLLASGRAAVDLEKVTP